MRHRYQITITDYRGARHFTLSQLMRRTLAGIVAGLALIFLGGSLMIHMLAGKVGSLNAEVDELQALHDTIASSNAALLSERAQLQDEVEDKARALSAISAEIDQIEILVGLQPEPERPLVQRIDTASQTAFEKRLMLESIPSGYPVESGRVTSSFGMRRHPIHDRMAKHGGVDLRAPRGTPIYATADGLVEWAAKHHNSGLGKMVKLIHNYGFSTVYGHLDEIKVESGSYVKRGQLLGYSGNTGASTAPHLHYEVRYLQRRLDPAPFLQWSLEDYDVLFTKEDRVQWESLAEVVRRTASVPERPSLQQAQSWSATLP
ncbi:M23 family metallopeptidase [Wenzhouxiangella sp. AB-CW3]|uniref:M23 family metallopeptidase n=1 Tax=Wenzhouxiangella sp. AB-CW3 TaxID=2771012 RepID=UPI00168BE676|nr:M23 family metallopeptidase [Wenzhouxiangella sp. AB-CW3]QOC23522.1 M23 family metallopeptidase [Wenzhouxiangella sp. AB-CW3]